MMAIIVTAPPPSYLGLYGLVPLASARRGVYRMSITDQGTGLMNRVAYEKRLRKERPARHRSGRLHLYRLRTACTRSTTSAVTEAGDQLAARGRRASAGAVSEGQSATASAATSSSCFPRRAAEAEYEARMRAVSESLAAQGYSISYGIAVCEAANGLRELVREADEKMLGSKRAYYAEHDRRRPR